MYRAELLYSLLQAQEEQQLKKNYVQYVTIAMKSTGGGIQNQPEIPCEKKCLTYVRSTLMTPLHPITM